MSPDRLALVEAILAEVRRQHPQTEGSCFEHPECKSRPTWVYPYRNGGYQRYFCDDHLPPQYRDIGRLSDANLNRLLDQLDALEVEEKSKRKRKPVPSLWKRILSG